MTGLVTAASGVVDRATMVDDDPRIVAGVLEKGRVMSLTPDCRA